jgi:hypothetical protein
MDPSAPRSTVRHPEDNFGWCKFHLARKQKNLNASCCCIGLNIWIVLCVGAVVFGDETGFGHHGKGGLIERVCRVVSA